MPIATIARSDNRNSNSAKRNPARPQVGVHSGKNLTQLAKDYAKDGRLKHFHYLNWSRAFLSKEAFPPPRLSVGCRFSRGTFARRRGNGRDVPKIGIGGHLTVPPLPHHRAY